MLYIKMKLYGLHKKEWQKFLIVQQIIYNISLHLKNIFKDNELDENAVVEDSSITASDGKNYKTKIYNLDAIIAVGYRVNSKKATEFRIWATKVLKEYMTKGFALNDERFIRGNKYDWWVTRKN